MKSVNSILSVVNAKGGVGKTTTAISIAGCLARLGYKTLAIDTDLQANLTHSLIGREGDHECIADALEAEQPLDRYILETNIPNLSIVPSGETLLLADLKFAGRTAREYMLRDAILRTETEFDFVIIDTHPYFGLCTLNALAASTHYLIPLMAEFYSITGLKLLQDLIASESRKLNPNLELLGILLTKYDKRESISEQAKTMLEQQSEGLLFNTVIRTNTRFKSAPAGKETIFEVEQELSDRKGSDDYESVVYEILGRLGMNEEAVSNG